MIELQANSASATGEAARIPASVQAAPAVLQATIQITLAATGKVEEYTIIGTPLQSETKEH
jgi:hypothetical protein